MCSKRRENKLTMYMFMLATRMSQEKSKMKTSASEDRDLGKSNGK